jgi:uncharacterized membrane protein YcfT
VDWVDYAKGVCIVLVVMMHSTLGVEAVMGREGWMHGLVEFARPFRIPAFFLISGLFLNRGIDRDWRTYLDRKVLHFAYFYLVWVTIQFEFRIPGMLLQGGLEAVGRAYLLALVEPFGTLWFIYLLPVFFVTTRLLRRIPPLAVWLFAAALEIAPVETGWTVIDEFASRFVYFYSGYILARFVFALADWTQAHPIKAIAALAPWAVVTGVLVFTAHASQPFVSLALGFVGAAAIVAICALLAQRDLLPALRYCGEHSLVIYLAFFLPMAAMRMVLIQAEWILDAGTISVLVTIASVLGALCLWWLVRNTRCRYLFARPERLRLRPKAKSRALQPAE